MKHLDGITVIEFGEYVSAPLVSRFLGEWGARIIKIERPEGDRQRDQGLAFGMGDFTKMKYNHNLDMQAGGLKEYVSIDIKTSEGMDILHRLLETADVFLTNLRPKALVKAGLDYDTLRENYPRLIYAMVYGYGEKGKYANSPGYDAVCYSARGGVMACFPQKGDAPANIPMGFGDFQAATALSSGVCAALLGREKTGRGDFVSVSLYHTALFMNTMGIVTSNEPYNKPYPKSRREVTNPLNCSYRCKDGKWLLICEPVYDLAIKKILSMMKLDDLAQDPFWTDISRVQAAGKTSEMIDILSDGFKERTRDEWIRYFEEHDIPGGPCFDYVDIRKDEFAWENDFLRTYHYPGNFDGIIVDLPIRFRSMGLGQLGMSKHVGADTFETLESYGYSRKQLEEWWERKIIYTEAKEK